MSTKIRASREKCVGAGACVTLASTIFDQSDDDALVVLLTEDVPDADHAAVTEAVDSCPAQAIWLEVVAE
jgi:ferredoxin